MSWTDTESTPCSIYCVVCAFYLARFKTCEDNAVTFSDLVSGSTKLAPRELSQNVLNFMIEMEVW